MTHTVFRFFRQLASSPARQLHHSRPLLLLLALLASLPLSAYGPATASRMTDVTLRLAPASLRSALLAYRTHLDRGVRQTLESYSSSDKGELAAAAASEAERLPALAGSMAPFEEIAFHFGRAAALVYLVNDPLLDSSDPRAAEVRADYYRYVEKKLPVLVVAFDGYDNPPLGGDVAAYLGRRVAGEGRYREALLFGYFPKGKRVSSDTFDDRSNAFGMAQLILSHAVSDAAKFWFNLWAAMNGDLSATPFYRRNEAGASRPQGPGPEARPGEEKKR